MEATTTTISSRRWLERVGTELFSTEFASNKKTCFLVQTIASRGVIDVITVAYCDEEFGPATVSDLFTNFNNSARNIEEEMG